MLSVDRFTQADKESYADLWRTYDAGKIRADNPQSLIAAHWKALMSSDGSLRALCLRSEGRPVGFALYVRHVCTKSVRPECYLSDLYIVQNHRRKGGASRLLDALIAECQAEGFERLSWITKPDNTSARALYERYGQGTPWIRYKLTTRS